MPDEKDPTQVAPPAAPANPTAEPTVDLDPQEDEVSATDRREAKKAEKELIDRATFQNKPAKEGQDGDPLFVVEPPQNAPWNTDDGFIGTDPTLQGPSDVRSVGPDTE